MFNQTQIKLSRIKQTGVEVAQRLLRKYDKVATQLTLDSIEGVIVESGRYIELVFSADKAWDYINDGRRPGAKMPPSVLSPDGRRLKLWFDVKNIPLSADFPVRRSIAKKGISAKPITQDFITEFLPIYEAAVADALAIDLADLGFELINKGL